ncbi:SprT-like domain-containing protein [Pedobacter sp.]|uniref:SprT-like domain-containing protein n=1 Tax=Pedobacter sp. TaxID=1411316 RepID=UPI002C4008A6|nr:SprT-like domain-containing protein [Pedobacter sp.]HWW39552.1 SprT-like domain-containing protein [Pedobacter sp.]
MEKVQVLTQYMPPAAAPLIAKWIDYFQCEFKISRNRATKLGDYRHPFKDSGHKISVNNDLNRYAFLVTTVHEFAHLLTWNEYKNKVKPHGQEWKNNFKRMMSPFLEQSVFPEDIQQAILTYLSNPSASSCTDLQLSRALKRYDQAYNSSRLEEIPLNTVFTIKDGRKFRKGERLRKRYRCLCLDNGNIYLFNPLAEVTLLATGT